MTESFYIGDRRKFQATFVDENGALADPTTVTAEVREPSGNIATPSVAPVSIGLFEINYEFSMAGRHIINFLGDGAINASFETEVWARHKGAV